jgi:hypothetical protein
LTGLTSDNLRAATVSIEAILARQNWFASSSSVWTAA